MNEIKCGNCGQEVIPDEMNNCPECGVNMIEDIEEYERMVNHKSKTLNVLDTADAKDKISDVEVFGNPDAWVLITKASSKKEGWMKSTKAMSTINGVIVLVSTQQGNNIAESTVFIPNAFIGTDENGNRFIQNNI